MAGIAPVREQVDKALVAMESARRAAAAAEAAVADARRTIEQSRRMVAALGDALERSREAWLQQGTADPE